MLAKTNLHGHGECEHGSLFFPKMIKTNFLLAQKKLLTIFPVFNHNKRQKNIQYSEFKQS